MCRYALAAILSLVLLSGCKEKNNPEGETGSPVFSVSGTANGIPVTFSAGVNDYYMSTSYSRDSLDIYVFKGLLSRRDCSRCGPSLSISFRNYTHSYPFNKDSALFAGTREFVSQLNPVETYYLLRCYSSFSGTKTPAISWDFGNSRYSTDPNPVVNFPTSGIYNITCSAIYPGCYSELNQPIFLTPTRVGKSTDFSVNYPDTHIVLLNSIPVSNTASVTWDFGDGQTGLGTIIKHTYSTPGMYKVCMQYVLGLDTMQLCKNVNTLDFNRCKVNYRFTSELITDSLHFNDVLVEWRDDKGILYSSGAVHQPQSSLFKILEVSDYQLNEKGEKTRKLKVMFTCLVSDGLNTVQLTDINATIAVAYP